MTANVVQNKIGRIMKKITSFLILRILIEVVPTRSFSSAKYVWPLTNSTYTYEVKNSKHGDYSQCGFHFAGDHPSFSGNPLQLNGHNYPFINIDIGDSNEFKAFSFALSANISGSNGCIFHFKSTSTSSSGITDVSVCLTGVTLTMEVTSSFGTTNATLSPSNVQDQWIIVQAGRNFDTNKLKFIVNNDIDEVSDTHGSKILGLPGTLRIGARNDETMALSLTATCITMYDVTTNTGSDVTEIEDQCKSPSSVSGIPGFPSAGCAVLDTTSSSTGTTTQVVSTSSSTDTTTQVVSTSSSTDTTTQVAPTSSSTDTTTQVAPTSSSTDTTTQVAPTSSSTDTTTQVAPTSSSTDTTTQVAITSSSAETLSTSSIYSTSVDTLSSQCTRIGTPNQQHGSFVRVVTDTVFTDPTNLIGIVVVFSKRKCAEVCFRNHECVSFLYSGSSVCSMYKTFTPSNPAPQPNHHLYILRCT